MRETPAHATAQPEAAHLHLHAVNSLARCKAVLMTHDPMYARAQLHLEEASKAVAALVALVAHSQH